MLKELFDTFSPCGFEDETRSFLEKTLLPFGFDIEVDNLGSLIARKVGNGSKICIECGMDTPGIMITAHENNTAYFSAVGSINPSFLENKVVRFNNGAYGIIRYNGNDITSAKISDLILDIDTGSVKVGDFGMLDSHLRISDDRIFSNDLGFKIPIKTVLDAIINLDCNADITIAFTSQKNLGARGIAAFFGANSFDRIITVNSVSTGKRIKSGSGCVLIAKDKKCVSDRDFLKNAENIAKENGVSASTAICDENLFIENISIAGNGAQCLCIAIPVEYKSKGFEFAYKTDICAAADLIKLILKEFA